MQKQHIRGLERNLEKIFAILNMKMFRTIQDIQSVNGKLTATSCFLAKSQKSPYSSKFLGTKLKTHHANKKKSRYWVASSSAEDIP